MELIKALGIDFYYHLMILSLSVAWLIALFCSLFKHRKDINFSSIILRYEEGKQRLSKVGITFCFALLLMVYQVTNGHTVDGIIVQIMMLCFATELTNKTIDLLPYIMGKQPPYSGYNNTIYNQNRQMSNPNQTGPLQKPEISEAKKADDTDALDHL